MAAIRVAITVTTTDGLEVITTDGVIVTTTLVTTMVIVATTTMLITIITATNQPEIRIGIKSERGKMETVDQAISSYN